ncbi:hypothetical protein HQ393_04990 [Chitinibacter bivalviorum]|uniref:Helix-turn-helix domain-containing protein n=1 Tax=Chitinibacter bivalviorum TaxID=2739434 RepID=A0A7H9BG30_9NEIS|nr:hypothetical protein [Chitinibacter bivalviorum]QLG87660.1 hypothetical protein HQ393_04990 [Chitinibacter bivalviorum]
MNAHLSTLIIRIAGGDTAFAKLIGLDPSKPGVQQRVHNWKSRGIPSAVVLENYQAITALKNQVTPST